MNRITWWMRDHLTSRGRWERQMGRRYGRAMKPPSPELVARWRECPHEDRRPNADAAPRDDRTFEVCNQCGIGLMTLHRTGESQ